MILSNLKKRVFTSIFLLSLLLLIFISNLILIYLLIVLGVMAIIEFLKLTKNIFKRTLNKFLINSFFIIYISIFCFMFFFFSNIEQLKIILYILLLGCIASDIGGFVFGKIFKGPKLTKISPNKTYAGALGSITLSLVVVNLLFLYLGNFLNYKIIIVALTTTIFCQLGDLIFSYLKRKAKIKDTGSFLPGHGGVLDRLDGIILGVPFGFLTLILLN